MSRYECRRSPLIPLGIALICAVVLGACTSSSTDPVTSSTGGSGSGISASTTESSNPAAFCAEVADLSKSTLTSGNDSTSATREDEKLVAEAPSEVRSSVIYYVKTKNAFDSALNNAGTSAFSFIKSSEAAHLQKQQLIAEEALFDWATKHCSPHEKG